MVLMQEYSTGDLGPKSRSQEWKMKFVNDTIRNLYFFFSKIIWFGKKYVLTQGKNWCFEMKRCDNLCTNVLVVVTNR